MSDAELLVTVGLTDEEAEAIRARMAAKGLVMEPPNDGADLSYLFAIIEETGERLTRDMAQA